MYAIKRTDETQGGTESNQRILDDTLVDKERGMDQAIRQTNMGTLYWRCTVHSFKY